ncbi:hypothetical protein Tco_0242204 [Tanacetum coccineum]|uniref:Uncharacterized protein n=1 Tax=Tanacetum coccineum TaxID=301880 RepID=A0ABQ5DX91_9ASTR
MLLTKCIREKALYGLTPKHLEPASTPMEPNKALVKDEEADNVDVHLYQFDLLITDELTNFLKTRPNVCCVELYKIVIMLVLTLTGNPQQEVANFLARGANGSKINA